MRVDTISEQLFFLTVKIETASSEGEGSGTGFIVNHKIGNKSGLFLVSNKHVVFDGERGWITFHAGKSGTPLLGQNVRGEVTDWSNSWIGHPDSDIDIAILPITSIIEHITKSRGQEVFFRAVQTELFVTNEMLAELSAIEDVTFVGYPNGIWDEVNLLPIARRGTTASPLHVDFSGRPEFIIDASVFRGSSGSPVFIFDQGSFSNRAGGIIAGDRLIFLGVITSVFCHTALSEITSVPIPTATMSVTEQSEMLDLGVVTKARTVSEAIDAFLSSKGLI
jgi:hypothetical protein